MPKPGFKAITISEQVFNRLHLLALAAGYRGYGAVPKYLKHTICGFKV